MRDNDPVVGAVVFAVDMLLRQITWRTEPASQEWHDLQAEQLLKDCMEDMSHTWEDLISEVLSMLVYGYSWHEVVYKRRIGDVRNPQFRSKFNDGLIGWRKMPIRSQETLTEWVFDEDGGVQAMKQLAPPDMKEHVIPIGKSLLFRTTTHKNNPEGRSILRNSYRPWYFKKRMEEIEGIGIERDLAGLPVMHVPAEMLSTLGRTRTTRPSWRCSRRWSATSAVTSRKASSSPWTTTRRQPALLLRAAQLRGTRAINIDGAITRYEQRIAMTILADFILLGHEHVGSYASEREQDRHLPHRAELLGQRHRRGLQPPRDPEALRPQRLDPPD
jgi:hypothetical protein